MGDPQAGDVQAADVGRQVLVPLDLLESLVDDSDCRFDHHGGCQEHGYLSLQQGEECPQFELKRRIEEANRG